MLLCYQFTNLLVKKLRQLSCHSTAQFRAFHIKIKMIKSLPVNVSNILVIAGLVIKCNDMAVSK